MFTVTCKGCQEYLSKPWFGKDEGGNGEDGHLHEPGDIMDGGMKKQDMIMVACKGSEKDHALVEKLLADGHNPNKPETDSGTIICPLHLPSDLSAITFHAVCRSHCPQPFLL
jgi:hypothetical protein